MRRTRRAVVVAASILLCLAGPVGNAAARTGAPPSQPPPVPAPWQPPPVAMSELPTPSQAATFPYRAPGQVGPATPVTSCATAMPGRLSIDATPPAQQLLQITQAHRFATGRDQTVAVIDSGVDPHPLLAGRLVDGGDYILGETALQDCEGHGTVVAGIIAAAPDPGSGFVGVAPDARILSIKQGSTFYEVPVTDPDSPDRTRPTMAGDTMSMARAIVHAVQRGATVINISEAACYPISDVTGSPIPDRDLQAAVHYAANRDVVVVAAAANRTDSCRQNTPGALSTIVSPAWFDEDVLAVAATDTGSGQAADFSIRGPWVDVAAPGTRIVSLAVAGGGLTATLAAPGGRMTTIQGTSFAVPYVAGLAALVRERFPQLSAREVTERIEQTAESIEGGHDSAVGHGMVDPVAALTGVPGSRDTRPEQVEPARLEDFAPPPQQNLLGTTAALAAGAGLGALGVSLLIAYLRRSRRPSP